MRIRGVSVPSSLSLRLRIPRSPRTIFRSYANTLSSTPTTRDPGCRVVATCGESELDEEKIISLIRSPRCSCKSATINFVLNLIPPGSEIEGESDLQGLPNLFGAREHSQSGFLQSFFFAMIIDVEWSSRCLDSLIEDSEDLLWFGSRDNPSEHGVRRKALPQSLGQGHECRSSILICWYFALPFSTRERKKSA